MMNRRRCLLLNGFFLGVCFGAFVSHSLYPPGVRGSLSTAQDLYSLLGVRKQSTQQEIKQAYKKLAIQYHPDKNPGDESAQDRFIEIQAAYETLSDDEKRRLYDLTMERFLESKGRGGRSHGYSSRADFSGGGRFQTPRPRTWPPWWAHSYGTPLLLLTLAAVLAFPLARLAAPEAFAPAHLLPPLPLYPGRLPRARGRRAVLLLVAPGAEGAAAAAALAPLAAQFAVDRLDFFVYPWGARPAVDAWLAAQPWGGGEGGGEGGAGEGPARAALRPPRSGAVVLSWTGRKGAGFAAAAGAAGAGPVGGGGREEAVPPTTAIANWLEKLVGGQVPLVPLISKFPEDDSGGG